MTKKLTATILIVILLLFVFIAINLIKNDKQSNVMNNDFIYLGIFREGVIEEENYVFTDYNDYISKFDANGLTKKDFEHSNYVLISMRYDSCSEEEIVPAGYTIDKNHIDVTIEYKARCGLCAPEYMYYLLQVDKTITNPDVNIDYKITNNPNCRTDVAYKPIIYLYPEKTTEVTVRLGNPDYLTITYPKYKDNWNVIANPDGSLIDKKTNRELYGLYWEGSNYESKVQEDGFIVKGEDTIEFLESTLSILGLTEREADEFIIYWLPKLETNKYNYIRFETIEKIDNYMPLEITPTPDTIIRVLMAYKPLDEKIEVREQKLITPQRTGFTVVEWGGTLIN